MKLGKLPKKDDPRNLQFENYVLSSRLPVVPGAIDYALWGPDQRKWGTMKNDVIGDCVAAAAGHHIQCWTGNASGKPNVVTVPDSAVVDMYSAISGYDPTDPTTDRGAYMLDGCKYLLNTGLDGHRIRAFTEVNPDHEAMMRAALWIGEGLYIGATLYDDIWTSSVWDAPPDGTSVAGGHAVALVKLGSDKLAVVTWGYLQEVTWAWVRKCVDEAYCLISPDSLTSAGVTPAGFDMARLLQDVQMVTA